MSIGPCGAPSGVIVREYISDAEVVGGDDGCGARLRASTSSLSGCARRREMKGRLAVRAAWYLSPVTSSNSGQWLGMRWWAEAQVFGSLRGAL